jgi:hypothetical protein
MKFIVCFLICFSFAFDSLPPDVKFEYAFKVGDHYVIEQNTKQGMKQTIMGMEQNFDNLFSAEYNFDVVELTSSGAKVKAQYIKLKNELKSTMIQSLMDSEGDTAKTENKIFRSLVKKPFFIHLNKRGEIEKLEGAENLWSDLTTLGLDENTQKMVKQNLGQMVGESMIKATFQQMLVTYSDKKVKEGDTWKIDNVFPIGFPVSVNDTWTVGKISGTEASFVGDGTAVSDKDKVVEVQGGLKAKADLSGRQAKKSSVNVKTGWPSKLELLSEMKGTMTLLAGGMIPEDMTIPLEVLTESSFSVLKK